MNEEIKILNWCDDLLNSLEKPLNDSHDAYRSICTLAKNISDETLLENFRQQIIALNKFSDNIAKFKQELCWKISNTEKSLQERTIIANRTPTDRDLLHILMRNNVEPSMIWINRNHKKVYVPVNNNPEQWVWVEADERIVEYAKQFMSANDKENDK